MEQLRESNTLYCRAVSKVFFEISVNFTARKISERALKSTLKTGTSYGAPQVLLKVLPKYFLRYFWLWKSMRGLPREDSSAVTYFLVFPLVFYWYWLFGAERIHIVLTDKRGWQNVAFPISYRFEATLKYFKTS